MLNSRSTRIAAVLLLTLLLGWVVRAQRKGGTHALPPVPSTPPAALLQDAPGQSVLNNE